MPFPLLPHEGASQFTGASGWPKNEKKTSGKFLDSKATFFWGMIPVEVGSLSHYLQGLYIPGGCLGFLNHQQYVWYLIVSTCPTICGVTCFTISVETMTQNRHATETETAQRLRQG